MAEACGACGAGNVVFHNRHGLPLCPEHAAMPEWGGPEPETVVNYVVEARNGDRPWITMANASGDEELARMNYQTFLGGKRTHRSSLEYRLVRRTAVITDEVLEHT